MKILIFPYAKIPPDGSKNAKNYPYWREVVTALKRNHTLIQVGSAGEPKLVDDVRSNLSMGDLHTLMNEADTFVSVDSFFPHMAHFYGKTGIVIFSQSDPTIFGYPENINLLEDPKYLRPNQFDRWDSAKYNYQAFVPPYKVVDAVSEWEKTRQNSVELTL